MSKIIMRKVGIIVISLAVMVAVGVSPVFAQPASPVVQIGSMEHILAIVNRIVGWAFAFFFALAALFILWAAFTYLTGGGEEKSVAAAKKRLMYAVIAIVIALIARGIVPFIQGFVGN